MRLFVRLSSIAALAVALAAVPGSAQKTTGPKAQYDMDVETVSGIAAMKVDVGSMLLGGGGLKMDGTAYRLDLRLGSSTAPAKAPAKADHFFLPAAKMGKSVPLLGPEPSNNDYVYDDNHQMPEGQGKPKGRLLLFWGCGAHAPKGQPVIIDFSKVAAGQVPPGLWTTKVPIVKRLTSHDFPYYAEWPNGKSGKQPKEGASLIGAHKVAGNFNPQIDFSLTQDFMGGLGAKGAAQADGSILLTWNGLAPATGYAAWAMGGKGTPGQDDAQDMVWWTSSSTREFGGGLWDWLPPATVAKLVTSKTVMPPSQTSCQVPAEVKNAAAGYLMGNLNAFGPEANFSYPPKPSDPKAVWNIDWTARVRYRSTAMLFLVGGMAGMEDAGSGQTGNSAPPPKEKKCKKFGIPIPCL